MVHKFKNGPSEAFESLQKQALRVIYDDGNYDLILILAEIDSLETPGPDLRGGAQGAQGPRPPTKRGLPPKPFNFYFTLTIG